MSERMTSSVRVGDTVTTCRHAYTIIGFILRTKFNVKCTPSSSHSPPLAPTLFPQLSLSLARSLSELSEELFVSFSLCVDSRQLVQSSNGQKTIPPRIRYLPLSLVLSPSRISASVFITHPPLFLVILQLISEIGSSENDSSREDFA